VKLISGEEALQEFRRTHTGETMLELVKRCAGLLLVTWTIGVGKSYNLDRLIAAAIERRAYDLVISLSPTRKILEERILIKNPSPGDRTTNIRPRPRKRCGDLDKQWVFFECRDMALLGRKLLCRKCPRRRGCFWPTQYGKKNLKNTQVIFATQAHLERSPTFIEQLQSWTGASTVLTILDEDNFVSKSLARHIFQTDLTRFRDALEITRTKIKEKLRDYNEEWIYLCDLLLSARTDDLRAPKWRTPPIFPPWALAVQEAGYELYGNQFRFLGYYLQQLGCSDLNSREKLINGDIAYSVRTIIPRDFVIYSGTAQIDFVCHRVGQDLINPFADYRFSHPDTTWYNLSSRLGTRKYFRRHLPQVLDFFAALIAQRIREGKRPLLVAKKMFVPDCAAELEIRLTELGLGQVQIVTSKWETFDLSDPNLVPLINYGVIGINLFEHFDCAYCLTSYYVNEGVINQILQDVMASDFHIPIKIRTDGHPRRRSVEIINPAHRFYDIQQLAPLALAQQEMNTVIQAVGRVRPYTKPREIITFQCAEHPQLPYTKEFHTIDEARKFFGILGKRHRQTLKQLKAIQAAKGRGLTQQQVAEELKISLRTVKRHWNWKVSRTI